MQVKLSTNYGLPFDFSDLTYGTPLKNWVDLQMALSPPPNDHHLTVS